MNTTWAVILLVVACAESGFMLLNYQVNVVREKKWHAGGRRIIGTHWSMPAWIAAHWAIRIMLLVAITISNAGSLL